MTDIMTVICWVESGSLWASNKRENLVNNGEMKRNEQVVKQPPAV